MKIKLNRKNTYKLYIKLAKIFQKNSRTICDFTDLEFANSIRDGKIIAKFFWWMEVRTRKGRCSYLFTKTYELDFFEIVKDEIL